MSKLLTLTIIMIISIGCSNKGNGDKFYVEHIGDNQILHSTLSCKAINGGVEIRYPGYCWCLMCSKCMDEDLYEIAVKGKGKDNDDDDF